VHRAANIGQVSRPKRPAVYDVAPDLRLALAELRRRRRSRCSRYAWLRHSSAVFLQEAPTNQHHPSGLLMQGLAQTARSSLGRLSAEAGPWEGSAPDALGRSIRSKTTLNDPEMIILEDLLLDSRRFCPSSCANIYLIYLKNSRGQGASFNM
jgi:hypothetical protein